MAEVLFYRGLIALMFLLVLIILYKMIYPWLAAACIKVENKGEEVLKKADSGDDPVVPVVPVKPSVPVKEKGEGEEDGVVVVTEIAAEVRKASVKK